MKKLIYKVQPYTFYYSNQYDVDLIRSEKIICHLDGYYYGELPIKYFYDKSNLLNWLNEGSIVQSYYANAFKRIERCLIKMGKIKKE